MSTAIIEPPQMLGSVRSLDNFDDRREIVIQLEKLTSEQRLGFLQWALNQAPINKNSGGKNPLRAVNDPAGNPFPWGSPEQCYFDLMIGIQQHNVPVAIVLPELERRAALKRI